MRILLVRLRLIGDVVLTTPLLRALRRRYPDAQLTYLVEPAAAPIVRGNPHINDSAGGPEAARPCAAERRPVGRAEAAPRGIRHRHRSAWRTPRRMVHVGQRRADTHRLQHRGRIVDVHPRRAADGRRSTPSLGRQPVGPAGAARHRAGRSGPRSVGDGGRSPGSRRCRTPSPRRPASAVSTRSS